jgi:Na+/proline symporter
MRQAGWALGAVFAALAAVATVYAVWLFAGDNSQGGRDELGALALALAAAFALAAMIALVAGKRRSDTRNTSLGR